MEINITDKNMEILMNGYALTNVNAYWQENNIRYNVSECSELRIENKDNKILITGFHNGRVIKWELCNHGEYITARLAIQSEEEVFIDSICTLIAKIKTDGQNQKFLRVPFDNDAWIKFVSKQYNESEMGYGAGAIYNQNGALIIGALEYDVWKTGIIPNENIEILSGVTGTLSRDRERHGTVHGKTVKSPLIYIGGGKTWQQGMMSFADTYEKYNKRLVWEGVVPFGWNSWYAHMKEIDKEKYIAASDFICRTGFNDKNISYINFDSFWNNLTDVQLAEAAQSVLEKGQYPGTYIAPFAAWISEDMMYDKVTYDTGEEVRLEGFEGIRYYDIILKDYNGDFLPPIDGGYPLDVTHPVVIDRLRRSIKYFGKKGYKYVKADFLGHAAVEGRHYRKEIQTGMMAYNFAMRKLMEYAVEEGMFISLSIAPLFPGGYGHARRICCDVFEKFKDTEYLLNSITYGFWQNKKLYEFTDPDHICFNGTYAEAKSRFISALIGGTLMLMSNDVRDEEINRRIIELTSDTDLLNIAREHLTFIPVDASIEGDFASVFVSENGKYMAVFNMTDTDKRFDLSIKGMNIGYAKDVIAKKKLTLSEMSNYGLKGRDCAVLHIFQ